VLGGLKVRAIPSVAYRLALAVAGEIDAAISLAVMRGALSRLR